MTYVDGFVLAVPTAKKEEYRRYSEAMVPFLKEHGVLSMVECWGVDVPEGKLTSFPMAVKCEPGETVVFSWMTWPSKEARDEGWTRIMADTRMNMQPADMPFDGKRLIHGGFAVIVQA